ncbi:MAG: YraN family protein [Clostridia bacterium]|nr:YraN family protein [Clostridia bacterium]
MSRKSETGRLGEQLACKYLEAQGFTVLHRNLRIGALETDIICENEDYIVFAEVKTRRRTGAKTRFGSARDAVDAKKKAHLLEGAREYLCANPTEKRPRIDLLEVYLSREEEPKITWIKNILG